MTRKKLSLTSGYENDRISSLPDDVLCHILSFLPTEDSVRTRVLSTRWKHLFSLVPLLNFYYSSTVKSSLHSPAISSSSSCGSNSFVDHLSTPKTTPISSDRLVRFLNFVDWVFNSYNAQQMDSFCFSSSKTLPETTPLLSWISNSVRRGVQKLAIKVTLLKPLTLPRAVFTCETLTQLSLDGFVTRNIILDVPEDICLPRLSKLELQFLSFIDVGSARRFFRSCPVLEDLFLKMCGTGDIYTLDISVPSLKSLTIFYGYKDNFNLVLDVPNVEKFVYYGGIVEHGSYSIQDFKLLMKAYISFHTYSSEGYVALGNLLSVVCHARYLSFKYSTLEAFQRSGRSLPIFCNLTRLEIENISSLDLEFVLDVLDSTPHLEVLEVDNVGFSAEDYNERGPHIHFAVERVPVCVSLHLKVVNFGKFLMLDNEFKLVEYLLKNAKILDTFKISFRGSLEKQVEIRKKLLIFSRGSRACQIVFDLDMEELFDLDMEEW